MTANKQQVMDIVADELGVHSDQVSVYVRLADLGADSLDCLGVAIRLEKDFGVTLCDEGVQRLKTVGDVIELVRRTTNTQGD